MSYLVILINPSINAFMNKKASVYILYLINVIKYV